MFYCYVLKSERTGRRYVGSCEDLEARLDRHNLGKVPATRHGTPLIILLREIFNTRGQAITRELYYKTGHGRDELDRITRPVAAATFPAS
jgi:putative endonuclease